jgi:hypothetical protein
MVTLSTLNKKAEVDNQHILQIAMSEIGKVFQRKIMPLATIGFYSQCPVELGLNKINELFAQFIIDEIKKFRNKEGEYKNAKGIELKGAARNYIFKSNDKYYLVDNTTTYSLDTFAEDKN